MRNLKDLFIASDWLILGLGKINLETDGQGLVRGHCNWLQDDTYAWDQEQI